MNGNKPRVLITGINSFTGKYLSSSLTELGYEVHGTVRKGEKLEDKNYEAELTDYNMLLNVIEHVAPRYVIHLAAVTFVAHNDVDDIYRTNIVGTHNLLSALFNAQNVLENLSTVLITSSANVYGNAISSLINEDEMPLPANDYAVSKFAMEKMAGLWLDKLPITIVRPFNYTGIGQSKNFIIPKLVDAFSQKSKLIELGNVDVYRDFSDVRDVVRAYIKILEMSPRGIFNICSGRTHSLREIIAILSDLSTHELKIKVNPNFVRQNEVHTLCGNPDRLKSVIPDWSPRPLKATLEWMLTNPY